MRKSILVAKEKYEVFTPIGIKRINRKVNQSQMKSLANHLQSRYKASTFEELAERVSRTVSTTKGDSRLYHKIISRQRFIPAGNTLLAGIDPIRPNCAILPSVTEDNFDEIVKRSVALWEDRIGIGFDLSEAKDPLKILSELSRRNSEIKLDHRPQRGNMAILNSSHPDIAEFVTCKRGENSLYNFNLSVGIDTRIPEDDSLMSLMATCAWSGGDPGIVFIDRVQGVPDHEGTPNKIHIPELGKACTLVPCGEQSMLKDESCTLGSINLACPDFWGGNYFNERLFVETIRYAVRFLDDVIDRTQISDPILKAQSLNTRRIGLGVLGWADVLAMNKIPYGSDESFDLAHEIGSIFKEAAHNASKQLADERGVCPALRGYVHRRNLTVTCIPPTGGITLLTPNKGFAIEPFFSEANVLSIEIHIKMQLVWQKYVDNCISKTINMPSDASPADILFAWNYAKTHDLKSITVYRDGSKSGQPIEVGNSSEYSTPDCPSGKCAL